MHKPINNSNSEAGFNLIEVTIVISIISALVGTIMIGRELVSGGKVVAVISELAYFTQAKEQFMQQYNYRPGDLPADVATQYFSRGYTVPDVCATPSNLGDGKWGFEAPEAIQPFGGKDGSEIEVDYGFNQLSVAELIKQEINFDPCSAGTSRSPGTHRPSSDVDSAIGYTFQGIVMLNPDAGTRYYLNALRIGKEDDFYLYGGAFNAKFFKQIDAKVDQPDTPISGKFIVESRCWSDNTGGAYLQEGNNTLCNGFLVETDPNIVSGGK